MILQGDSLEVLKSIKDNTIDSLVTDPPYGIAFMGKSWDDFSKGQEKQKEKIIVKIVIFHQKIIK